MVCHYLVKGRVQGVGFRWFVHREAAASVCADGFAILTLGTSKLSPQVHGRIAGVEGGWKGVRRGGWFDAVVVDELVESEAAKLDHLRLKEPGKNDENAD